MATMVKEKSKEKRKSKDKHKLKKVLSQDVQIEEQQSISNETIPNEVLPETQTIAETTNVIDKSNKVEKVEIEQPLIVTANTTSDVNKDVESTETNSIREIEKAEESVLPSAPLFEENVSAPATYLHTEKVQEETKTKVTCLPLDEAIRLFGGKELAEVRAISEQEEAIVEAGPRSTPDHPLIDLLSTFRTSLIAVDRERNRLSCKYVEEERSRATLWKVEKRTLNLSEKCPCGTNVNLKANFDIAKLDRERLSAARLRLEALLQDVQDSYCHHQHTALQTHCDIDEVINETIQKPNEYIREALSLVFDALRFSDAAPAAYAQALQRWASVLSSVLLEEENLNHLLFVLHNLFRQTRSVQWAGHVVSVRVPDMCAAARLLGVLELLLTRPVLESAHECTEDSEAWEELDDSGEGCAVGEGRLRERDLLALLQALPLRDLLARLALFSRQDLSEQSEQWWGDASGGHGVLKASCGVRAALGVCVRARRSHAGYARLLARLRTLAAAALHALAALHMHSRSSYVEDLAEKIPSELEACFAAGLTLLGEEAHKLPATLLSDNVAEEYCNTLIGGLHDKSVHIASLSVEVEAQSCGLRTRIVAQAALSRPQDQDLARTVLDFLFQTGIHRKPACKGLCDVTARELLPELLAVHPHVHTLAFHMLADNNQVEADGSLLEPLSLKDWRPAPAELAAVLDDWALRCPQLLQHLLLNLDYTPHTGVALESQLCAGSWVCEWAARRGAAPDWAWRVLRALCLHRSLWRGAGPPPPAPPVSAPPSALHAALALLAGDWGHSVPLACGPGAEALLQLAQTRPLDALHCAGFVMRVMAQSPESISFTPKFTEIFATILNFGPSLVQRALGQRADSGADLLQKLVLDQLQDPDADEAERDALLRAWLHALWAPALPPRTRALLDRALRRTRAWRALDAHVAAALQEESGQELVRDGGRHAGAAPLLCECALRHAHARELATHMYARLLAQLARQRAAAQRIHVDNALKQIGSSLCDDELSIHRCACAVLSVPMQHPAHLLLWRLLMHMWLHRGSESASPVGPLFFSGIVKSRTLAQLKKRLQETATYHRNQVDVLKASDSATSSTAAPSKVRKNTPPLDNNLFQTLSIITDLIGDTESDQDETEPEGDSDTETRSESETKGYDVSNLISYHTAAEKMVREYLMWLEEGENVRAYPHHADIARYISEQALDAAWRASLDDAPPPPPARPALPAPPAPPAPPARPATHFERAVAAVMSVEDGSRKRYNMHTSHISISDTVMKDPFLLIEMVEKYIEELKKLTEQWQSDCFRVALLDSQLWDLVEGLRVRRPLPPVRAACPQDCKPIVVHIPEDEWCISSGAEQAILENRRSARAAVRRLSRPRPHAARVASLLHSVGRRIWSAQTGARAAQLAWGAAPRAEPYPPARDALAALVAAVAQRWLNHDSVLTSELLARWSTGSASQQQLCGLLVTPARMPASHWPRLYGTVLALPLPPHALFSYLSKFDMTHWADVTDTSSRNEVLESIVKAATRIGPEPQQQDLVLVEILGVHSAALVRERELCEHVLRCARACAAGALPPPYCAHLPALAGRARDLHLEQIGRLLHDLGIIWWEARSSARSHAALYAEYAPHFANTLHSLLKEFVAAAVSCTYTPERVAYCSWPVLQTSWCPWVAPQSSLSQIDHQREVLERFVETIRMVMDDCPGSAEAMLRYTWEWAAQCALGEPRASCALLAQLARLPWETPWLRADCVPLALQLCGIADEDVRRWFGEFVRHASAACWLRGAADAHVSPALAALLALFTAARPLVPPETLEGACQLPWHRLPLPALDAALERYFAEHHNPGLPYHELPHFRVLLCASRLQRGAGGAGGGGGAAGEARALCVSQWARALASPALRAHVAAHTRYLLSVLTDLAPSVEAAELTELMSRALVVLCVQPADAIALPVWEQWARACDAHVRRACTSAVASLTAIDSFAALGDTLVKAIMTEKEPVQWAAVSSRWAARCAWGAAALLASARPHAAYAALLARAHPPAELRDALRTLLAADIDFVENEVIISVWICVASRVSCGAAGGDECAAAARALLTGWAERRRTLLQLVTLQPAGNCPTAQQQLLCRLSLHVQAPSDATWRALESARSACAAPAAPSARAPPAPRAVPQLAAALHPAREHYFAHELLLTPDQ
ncbi:uncharacterized protein LOC124535431 [Vanessa cardui]|uniref:uncharacterized protein LOC124535431 n=1 Tax=Vanessa cardui TaxID=171605 RepID=UPI001F13F53E|nr:uncharacterized protein LOC124535431 [Vanessa cardui]